MGGVGVAGSMSEGERALREVLKESDASSRLESLLPNASPAGQLYALLALRLRDRAAHQRALEKYGANSATVQTMRGCILQKESFRDLVEQIEHGDYDSFLSRNWPNRHADLTAKTDRINRIYGLGRVDSQLSDSIQLIL
ncbi:MAG: hypothetical protein QOF24_2739 [Verrucomicrobiota bacterium]